MSRRRNSPRPDRGQPRKGQLSQPAGGPSPSLDAYLRRPGAIPAKVAHAEERALESLLQKTDALHRDVEKLQERCSPEQVKDWNEKIGAIAERLARLEARADATDASHQSYRAKAEELRRLGGRVARLEGRSEAAETERTWQFNRKAMVWAAVGSVGGVAAAIAAWLALRPKPAEAVPLTDRIEVLAGQTPESSPCASPPPPDSDAGCYELTQEFEKGSARTVTPSHPVKRE